MGICCKATELPATAFGPEAREGSEGFRFETIASKPSFILDQVPLPLPLPLPLPATLTLPSFILDQLDATLLPVVWLDVDLEFHSFPQLFVPGGWPNGPRDVAIFNYWGNESDWEHASTPTTGSGVVFFNQVRLHSPWPYSPHTSTRHGPSHCGCAHRGCAHRGCAHHGLRVPRLARTTACAYHGYTHHGPSSAQPDAARARRAHRVGLYLPYISPTSPP